MKEAQASRLSICAALVLLAALVLPACGGSGTTASSSPSTTPGEATASPSPAWSPTMSPATIPVVKPGGKLPSFSKLAELFAYDANQPLDFESQPGGASARSHRGEHLVCLR